MSATALIETWFERFPALRNLTGEHRDALTGRVFFPELEGGAVAYHEGSECPNYVMCLSGGTRSFKTSPSGRELLLYRVGTRKHLRVHDPMSASPAGGFRPKAWPKRQPASQHCRPPHFTP